MGTESKMAATREPKGSAEVIIFNFISFKKQYKTLRNAITFFPKHKIVHDI